MKLIITLMAITSFGLLTACGQPDFTGDYYIADVDCTFPNKETHLKLGIDKETFENPVFSLKTKTYNTENKYILRMPDVSEFEEKGINDDGIINYDDEVISEKNGVKYLSKINLQIQLTERLAFPVMLINHFQVEKSILGVDGTEKTYDMLGDYKDKLSELGLPLAPMCLNRKPLKKQA